MKPFGSPVGGRQPYLPGPKGRNGRGSSVVQSNGQQQGNNTSGLDRSPGERSVYDGNPDPESKDFGKS
jgi:hypothetical protein